jgi:O-methyltransferase involved in polyketide biosynthesis
MTLPPGDGTKLKLDLKAEQETLVINLYSRALDYRSRHPILNDAKAGELVDRIDYNFENLRSAGGGLLCARARQLDEWILEFLRSNPTTIVLNLGCGLDARAWRLDSPPQVRWFDVDFAGVMAIRRRLFPERPGYLMIESSVTQLEWLEAIPSNGPGLVVADGVFEYLTEEQVRSLLHRLTDHFAHGEIVFDVISSRAMKMGNSRLASKTEARLRWAVDDSRQIVALNPKLRLTSSIPVLGSKYFPLRYRLLYGLASLIRRNRNVMRLVRGEF